MPELLPTNRFLRGLSEVDPGCDHDDEPDQAARQHDVRHVVLEDCTHHEECVIDLGPAEHEDARAAGILAQPAQRLVLVLEQTSHCRGQQFFEPDE